MADLEERDEAGETGVPAELAPPIESRFLFVDVAAQRANQLRRGARIRLEPDVRLPHKLERTAMEEVRRRLVSYELPELPTSRADF
jgi:DNA-directed RNA polymerase subunit K/omega